jgi:hypothetical protein
MNPRSRAKLRIALPATLLLLALLALWRDVTSPAPTGSELATPGDLESGARATPNGGAAHAWATPRSPVGIVLAVVHAPARIEPAVVVHPAPAPSPALSTDDRALLEPAPAVRPADEFDATAARQRLLAP